MPTHSDSTDSTCPTCGSDKREERKLVWRTGCIIADRVCDSTWHTTPTPAAETCPTCGSGLREIRRQEPFDTPEGQMFRECRNDWHDTSAPPSWEHGRTPFPPDLLHARPLNPVGFSDLMREVLGEPNERLQEAYIATWAEAYKRIVTPPADSVRGEGREADVTPREAKAALVKLASQVVTMDDVSVLMRYINSTQQYRFGSTHDPLDLHDNPGLWAAFNLGRREGITEAEREAVAGLWRDALAFIESWDASEDAMEDLREQRHEYGNDHPTIAPMRQQLRDAASTERKLHDALHITLANPALTTLLEKLGRGAE